MANTIYVLKDPRDMGRVRYVGVTRQTIGKRLSGHICAARGSWSWPVHRWIRKLLAQGIRPVAEALETTDDRCRERHWIAHFLSTGVELLNCAEATGDGISLPAETRARLSAASKAAIRTPEWRARMSAAQKGHAPTNIARGFRHSDATKELMSARAKGRKHTPEAVARMAAALRGKKKSPEHVKNATEARRGYSPSAETRAKLAEAGRQRKGVTRKKSPLCHKGHPRVMRPSGLWVCRVCAREWAQAHYCPEKAHQQYLAKRERELSSQPESP